MSAGISVRSTSTQATQKVFANALAASAGFVAPLSWLVSITDMTATPTELAICWVMLSRVEPRATSWWRQGLQCRA